MGTPGSRTVDCVDDNLLATFARGGLSAEERAVIDAHLDTCDACRKVVVGVAAQLSRTWVNPQQVADSVPGTSTGPLSPGTSVGRYVLQRVLGSGGMGVVYGAYDPQLDREVALKLLKPGLPGDGEHRVRDRMVREAQVLARLSHPNVVVVHDAGLVGDQVYLAMEWVRGQTLRLWLRQEPRSTREIVDMFLQAGRGLAAAHAQGIVHRDFKPDNVLVGTDGRARVTDFGLAQRPEGQPRPDDDAATGPAPSLIDAAITHTGTLMGTPAYMPPEQARGEPVDARADQYAFFTALAEALRGEASRPRRMGGYLQRAIARGTRPAPADRFPSMEAALGAIETGRRRRRIAATAFGASSILAIAIAASAGAAGSRDLCGGAERHVASVWSQPRREAMQRAFLASGRPYAATMFDAVSSRIDDWTRRWRQAHREACEATRIHEVQSEAVMTLRMNCLDQRLRELDAVGGVLGGADPQVVDRALDVLGGMGELSACANPETLSNQLPPPAAPQLRARTDALMAELNTVEAMYRAGQLKLGASRAEKASREADALGWAPATARAHWLYGMYQLRLGRERSAEDSLYRAAGEAVVAGADAIAARAWIELVRLAPPGEENADTARRAGQLASAFIARDGSPVLRAQLFSAVGHAESRRGRHPEAAASFERALAIYREAQPAEVAGRATAHMNLGNALGSQNRFEEALAQYQRALEVNERALGKDHPDVAQVQFNLGITLARAGKYAEAEAPLRRALRVYEVSLGTRAPQTAAVLGMLANVLNDLGRPAESLELQQRAVETLEAAGDPRNPRLATALGNLANALLAAQRPQEALRYARRAVELKEEVLGADNPGLTFALTALGTAYLDSGDAARAVEVLRRSLRLQDKAPAPPITYGETRFRLAQALWRTGNRREALALARKVMADDSNSETEELRGEATTWVRSVTKPSR